MKMGTVNSDRHGNGDSPYSLLLCLSLLLALGLIVKIGH